jgi:ABC-type glycerol-3-phosphate transport system substrate-binding protein
MRNEEDYDGYMVGNWPAGEYHEPGWAADLNKFIEDEELTDQDWLAMDDFMEQTIEFMTFPDEDGGKSFIGFPNGIEVYGCVGYDMNTYDTLGLEEPTTFEELEQNAKAISESDEVDQEGMVSRAASATLSAANFGTMFRSHDAEWIDREILLAEDDPDPADVAVINSSNGVEALERFASILYNYGVPDAAKQDWYGNNAAYDRGDAGMIYSTPQTSGIIDTERIRNTRWIPPLQTEDGRDRVANTWVQSTAISSHVPTRQQQAAWLFIQWANSRAANFMLSTHQWEDDIPRAGHARFDWIWEQDSSLDTYEYPIIDGHEGYEMAFRVGMDLVPTSPPPVPADTTQCMEIMSQVADAMNSAVANGPERAQTELDAIEQTVGEAAKQIPERYLRSI